MDDSMTNFKLLNFRITFKNVPLYKIEKFSFKDVTAASQSFKAIPGISECVILQTTSRVEIFAVIDLDSEDSPDARRTEGKGLTINKIKESWISSVQLDQWDVDHIDQTLEVYQNDDVYPHLLRVATGLESVVVGSEDVFNIMKKTIADAKQNNLSGPVLNKLFDTCISAATKIRDTTGIGKDIVTIGDLAIKLVEQKSGIDAKKKIVILGTGELAAMIAKVLNRKGAPFEVASMTLERATGFTKTQGGKPIKFEDVLNGFDKFDIVFVATTADYHMLNYDRVKLPMMNKNKGIMIADISQPRAVDENITGYMGVKLILRDQLTEMEEMTLAERAKKVSAVEKMLETESGLLVAAMNA